MAFFLPLTLTTAAVTAQDVKDFDTTIRPILARHCLACHGPEKPKRGLRLDKLSADFHDPATQEKWRDVLKRVAAGDMPPKSKPRPAADDIRALSDWINTGVRAAEAKRRTEGRVVLRRLNRVEYENTVRDLLGIHIDLQDVLPQDEAAAGFDNVGEALHVSSFLMERYLEAAERALDLAIANKPRPPLIKNRYHLKDQHQVKTSTERVFRKLDDGVVMFSSSAWQAVHLYQLYPPDRGNYRFRIAASAYQSDRPVTYRIDAGLMGMAGKSHLVGYFDAPVRRDVRPPERNAERVLEFVDHLEARATIRIHPYGLASAQLVDKIGADKYQGPGLAIHWIDVEGPLHDSWPPESHRRIFGDLKQAPAPNYRVEVVSTSPESDARRIITAFARRAWRRKVTDDDVKPLFALVKAKLAEKYSFERAVRVGLMGAMLSPNFLFLREGPLALTPTPSPGGRGELRLDDFALANRLSYFLWSTMPDEELLTLAEQSKLGQSETLRLQVERMLKHPKAAAFTENFVGQWLGLREIDATMPSHILYPEYDDMLKESMLKETHLFFDEVLKRDLSLTNFISSDFSILNARLAKHYGIRLADEKLRGSWEFRKTTLPADSHRGGVLTMGSVLKVTANGTYTSPILRGAWVLDRIMGTPPPRPPDGIAAVEPDIRGATTIRQQLAKHRQAASCAGCHAKIDPPGFALESFDVIGGWRSHYRATGNGKEVVIDGRRMPYLQGPKVDPADVLPDGRRFQNIDELKQLLLKDKEQIARALTSRLVTYATGAPAQAADQPEIDAIVRRIRNRDYGLRTLVHEIVRSEIFRKK